MAPRGREWSKSWKSLGGQAGQQPTVKRRRTQGNGNYFSIYHQRLKRSKSHLWFWGKFSFLKGWKRFYASLSSIWQLAPEKCKNDKWIAFLTASSSFLVQNIQTQDTSAKTYSHHHRHHHHHQDGGGAWQPPSGFSCHWLQRDAGEEQIFMTWKPLKNRKIFK